MDVEMPIMNGYVATSKIREIDLKRKQHTCIVALTSNSSNEDIARTYQSGVDEYVVKPYEANFLSNVINRVKAVKHKICGTCALYDHCLYDHNAGKNKICWEKN